MLLASGLSYFCWYGPRTQETQILRCSSLTRSPEATTRPSVDLARTKHCFRINRCQNEREENPLWERVLLLWAYLDLNQGPLPYQGSALTKLSYRPQTIGILSG